MKQSENSYYKSIDTLTVDRFYAMLNTEDLRYLVKGFEKGDELELTEEEENKLADFAQEIRDDYSDILANGKGRSDLLILGQIADMEIEIMVVGSLIAMMLKTPSDAISEELAAWKYPADLDKAFKKLESLKFRLSILKSKNRDLLEKSSDDDEKIEYDLYRDVVLLEQALGVSNLDPKTMVVAKWVNYLKVAQEKNKKNG